MPTTIEIELAPGMVAQEPAWTSDQCVVLSVAATEIAVPLDVVLEVERVPELVPVPGGPEWALGVANLRGTILTVVDLARLLGIGAWSAGPDGRVVVVRSEEPLALVVDGVSGMRRLSPATRFRLDDGLPEGLSRYTAGLHRDGGELIHALDLPRLLDDADERVRHAGAERITGLLNERIHQR